MPINTWLSILLFAVFVAPGLVFDLLSARRRAGLDESTFREIGRTVLASLAFSGVSVSIVLVVDRFTGWIDFDIRGLLSQSEYSSQLRQDRIFGLLSELALALLLAYAWHLLLSRFSGGASIRQRSAWTTVFRIECPIGHQVFARVRMNEDVVYYGRVAYFTANLDVNGRELVLAKPLYSKVGGAKMTPVPPGYQRIVLRGDAIDVVSVEYIPTELIAPANRSQLDATPPDSSPSEEGVS